jgi:hypothetical protein
MSLRLALVGVIVLVSSSCTRSDLPATLVASEDHAVFDTIAGVPYSERLLTFTNTGSRETPALTVELNGDLGAFTVQQDLCTGAKLPADGSCEVRVRLDPGEAGSFEGELRVSALPLVSAEVLLSGRLLPAELGLRSANTTHVDVTQGAGPGAAIQLVLENKGGLPSGPVKLSAIDPFVLSGSCVDGPSLAPGDSCNVFATFPGVGLDKTGTFPVTLTASASPGGSMSVDLSATVLTVGALSLPSLDWGSVAATVSYHKALTLTNPTDFSSGALTFTVTEDKPGSSSSLQVFGCKGQLAAHQSCTVDLHASIPAGSYGATLTVQAEHLHPAMARVTAQATTMNWMLQLHFGGDGTGYINVTTDYDSLSYSFDHGVPLANGSKATLTATPSSDDMVFNGWSGDVCSGTGPCIVSEPADTSLVTVTAIFVKR